MIYAIRLRGRAYDFGLCGWRDLDEDAALELLEDLTGSRELPAFDADGVAVLPVELEVRRS